MAFIPPAPRPKGIWRRTPPAIFLPILGLMCLGLAARTALVRLGLSPALAELFLGAAAMFFAFALLAYLSKALRRPGALLEDLRVLPSQAGVAALVLAGYLFAQIIAPYASGAAQSAHVAALALHAALIGVTLWAMARAALAQRRVTPVWHLIFSGLVVAGDGNVLPALPVTALFWLSMACAVAIWAASAVQFYRQSVPAPLRPLLVLHLMPLAFLGPVAQQLGLAELALALALLALLAVFLLVFVLRWLLAAGFSPLWGAFAVPVAALADFWLGIGGVWFVPGGLTLAAAMLIVPQLGFRLTKLWATGQLAAKTNAAVA